MSKKTPLADATKSLQKHYVQRYQKDGHPHFLMAMKPDDIKTWYVLFLNMEGPYAGGEFLMKLEAPDTYPFSPPVFTFMTPNNRFKTDGKPCVDMGHYHSNNWSPQTGMYGFTVQIYYALNMPMSDLGGGIGIYTPKEQSDEQKIACAKASIEYNKKNYKDIMVLFEDERVRHQELTAALLASKEAEKNSKPRRVVYLIKPASKEESDDDSVSSLSMPDDSDISEDSETSEKTEKSKAKKGKSTKLTKSFKPAKKGSKKIADDVSENSLSDLSEDEPAPKSSKKSVATKKSKKVEELEPKTEKKKSLKVKSTKK